MSKGRFGIHGGQYIPETLMNEIINLEMRMSIIRMILILLRSWIPLTGNMQADRHFFIMQRI